MTIGTAGESTSIEIARLQKRLERERRARLEAEAISERVTRDLYQRQQELQLLQTITVAANSARTVQEALQIAIDRVCGHIDWPVGHAFLLTEGAVDLQPSFIWHLSQPARFDRFRRATDEMVISPGVGLPGMVALSKQPEWMVDVTRHASFIRRESALDAGLQSGFAFPVFVGSEVVAVLEFFTDRRSERNDALLALMSQVGVQLGRVIERQRAAAKHEQQFNRLRLLNEINQSIVEWQDYDSLIGTVLRQLELHLMIDLGAVLLFDAITDSLTVATLRLRTGTFAPELSLAERSVIPVEQSGLRSVIEGRLTCYESTTDASAPILRSFASAGMKGVVAVPLIVRSKVSGILLVGRSGSGVFSSGECEFLRMLSVQVAVASDQSRMHMNLRRAYDELRQTQQAVLQQERLRSLGQMASGIAHDINNTLSSVIGYADLLRNKVSDPETQQYLDHIKTAGEDIGETVARLREFYRHREHTEVLAPVNLNEQVQKVIDLTRPRWRDIQQERGIGIRIETELAPELPEIIGNSSELREALTNLIFNAADAMPKGGTLTIRSQIQIIGGESGGSVFPRHVVLEIIDSGIGMDEETRRRCLEPFFTTKGERGTGLGLATVYGVMERHEGTIEIRSRLGAGTTIRLIFPVRQGTATDGTSDPTPLTPIGPKRILYIDDEPLLRELVKSLLDLDLHTVHDAEDGTAGLAAFQRAKALGEPYDIVITDLGMPGMDGREVARQLKAESPDTPVIMMTGWGLMMKSSGENHEHIDAVVSKPARLHELREALARVCRDR